MMNVLLILPLLLFPLLLSSHLSLFISSILYSPPILLSFTIFFPVFFTICHSCSLLSFALCFFPFSIFSVCAYYFNSSLFSYFIFSCIFLNLPYFLLPSSLFLLSHLLLSIFSPHLFFPSSPFSLFFICVCHLFSCSLLLHFFSFH